MSAQPPSLEGNGRVCTIRVAQDFSRTPGGRLRRTGAFSGQDFRERLLAPSLREAGRVIVNLDGVDTYIGSFLEEAFGGLIRENGFDLADLSSRLEVVGTGEFSVYRDLALRYMTAAAKHARLN